jgi:hypothetical protein
MANPIQLSAASIPPPSVPEMMLVPYATGEIYNRVIQPYDTQTLASLLETHKLSAGYPNLILNLTYGFPIGKTFPITKNNCT